MEAVKGPLKFFFFTVFGGGGKFFRKKKTALSQYHICKCFYINIFTLRYFYEIALFSF